MDEELELVGRLAAVARGLEREGAYNGAKLARTALGRALTRYAESAAPSGGMATADALEQLLASSGELLPANLHQALQRVPDAVRSGTTIALETAPRCHLCRVCGEVFIGETVPSLCPVCSAPALSFREELPVWFLEPADPGAILAALAAGPGHLRDALSGRSDEQLARPPEDGEWSARQVLEHLLFAEELFSLRVGRLLKEDDPDLAARAVWAETPAGDEGSVRSGEPASVLADRISALRAAAVARLNTMPETSWGRAGNHPEWGRVTVLSQAAYFARHEASHLAQLVAAAAGRVPGRA